MRRRWLRASLALVAFVAACHLLPAPSLREQMPIPTRFWSRPLVLEAGLSVGRAEVRGHLQQAGYRKSPDPAVAPGEFTLGRNAWRIGLLPFEWPDGRDPGGRLDVSIGADGRIHSLHVDAEPTTGVFLPPVLLGRSLGSEGQDRQWVALEEIPRPVAQAVLAAEDQRFRWHPGVDPIRIAGAALANLRSRSIAQGASTLTQQLVKNTMLGPERTWSRKLREIGLAVWLELRHSKDEILEAYLNQVYLGQDGGRAIHGVEIASLHHFGVSVRELEWSRAALLAAIIRSPNRLSPRRHPERARQARDRVLDALAADDMIPAESLARAKGRPLGIATPMRPASRAAHFRSWVERRLAQREGEGAAGRIGAQVFTTLDPALQRAAEAAVREGLAGLERRFRKLRRRDPEKQLQAAVVVLDPRTGDVLALVGARDAARSPFDRASAARRQPGSVFKPIVALAAVSGRDSPALTLATILEDAPLAVPVEEGIWRPRNHDHRHLGPVTLRTALEQSRNVPFARLGMEVGLVRVAETARALGIEGPLRPVPSLSLGAFEASPLEMTGVYATLAAGGVHHAPRTTLAVRRADGSVRDGDPVRARRVADPVAAFLVTSALRGAIESGTAAPLRTLGVEGPWAGKTGTTNGARDAWFLAYTRELAVGVWVGFDDGAPLGRSGAEAALPIFARFAHSARSALPAGSLRPVTPPPGVVRARVAALAGAEARDEWFRAGTVPRPPSVPERLTRWVFRLAGHAVSP